MIRFRTLGTVDLRDGEGRELTPVLRRPKLLALLGYLGIARPPGFHRRDTLVALLWPELDHAHARNALRQALHAAREALGRDVFLTRGEDELGVNEEVLCCDVREFEKALEAGDAETALDLNGGGLLCGLHVAGVPDFERWLDDEREHVRQRACEAARLLTDRDDADDNSTGAARWARRLTELSPSDEKAVRRLIGILDRAGDRAGAVRAYEDLKRRLARDLELEPSSKTQGLAHSIRTRRQSARAAVAPAQSIAVLPFGNLSPDAETSYFGDGTTEALINALVKLPGLHVVARSSVVAVSRDGLDARTIGERLQVRTLLAGSVRRIGDRLRITAQLIDAASGYHLWSDVYDRGISDVFAVQDELVRAIVGALKIRLSENTDSRLVQPATRNLQAYTCYLKGRASAVKRTPDGLRAAVEWFSQAVRADPDYALAYAGLAEAYHLLSIVGVAWPKDAYPRARLAAQKALALNDNLAESHLAASYSALCFEWDWTAAETGCRRAIELNPTLTQAHHWLAWCLVITGRKAEAAAVVRRAMELEPFSPIIHARGGQILAYAGFLEESEAASLRALELDPCSAFAHETLAITYTRRAIGRYDDAVDILTRAIELPGSMAPHFLPWVHALRGDRRAAVDCLEALHLDHRTGRIPPTYTSLWIVGAFSVLGDRDEAFRWLDLSIANRVYSAPLLCAEEGYDAIRSDPRFAACLQAVGLAGVAAGVSCAAAAAFSDHSSTIQQPL